MSPAAAAVDVVDKDKYICTLVHIPYTHVAN